jgi:hypothetical protein
MNTLKQFIAWLGPRLLYIAIVALAIVLVFYFIGKRTSHNAEIEYQTDLTKLETLHEVLTAENKDKDKEIERITIENKLLKEELKKAENARKVNQNEISRIKQERDSALHKIQNMSSNEVYDALMILYSLPGKKEFLFNNRQIGEIYRVTVDYKLIRKEVHVLEKDISDCDRQVAIGDSIMANMNAIIAVQNEKESNNEDIISNLKEENDVTKDQLKKQKRKNFWTKVGAVVVIVAEALFFIATSN